jgi:hypothetical protein
VGVEVAVDDSITSELNCELQNFLVSWTSFLKLVEFI